MKNFKISITLDSLFIFNGVKFIPSLILSIIISLIIATIFLCLLLYKSNKKGIKLIEETSLSSLKNELCFMDKNALCALFLNYYKKSNILAKAENNYIVLPENNTVIFFNFTYENTDTSKIIHFYKQTKTGYKTVVLSINYTADALTLVNDLSLRIKLFDLNAVYLSLKKLDLLPNSTISKKQNKIAFLDKIKGVFVKSNGKKALMLGGIILLSSKLSFYPIYYIIFGSFLIIFSLTLHFFGKQKAPIPSGIDAV